MSFLSRLATSAGTIVLVVAAQHSVEAQVQHAVGRSDQAGVVRIVSHEKAAPALIPDSRSAKPIHSVSRTRNKEIGRAHV